MSGKEKLSLTEDFSDRKLSDQEAADFFMARQIMQEIKSFGINQNTALKLVELLALELESREKMLGIIHALKGNQNSPVGSAVLEK